MEVIVAAQSSLLLIFRAHPERTEFLILGFRLTAAKGGSLFAKEAILSFFGSYAGKTCHKHPRTHAQTKRAMLGVVMCR